MLKLSDVKKFIVMKKGLGWTVIVWPKDNRMKITKHVVENYTQLIHLLASYQIF